MKTELYAEMAELEESHWWFRGRRAIVLDVLSRFAPHRGRLLDVGLGTGYNAAQFSKRGFAVEGVEPSPEGVAFARTKAPMVSIIESAFPSPQISAHTYDVVTMLDVLEHFRDDTEALRCAAEALRPGGVVLITVPAFQFLWTEHDALAHHVRRYRKPELRARLAEAGLEPLMVSYYNFFLFPAIAGVRYMTKWSGLRRTESDFTRTPDFLNAPLAALFGAERWLLRIASLPFGVSLIAVAIKK